MSGPEIAHRVVEQCKRASSQKRRYGWDTFASGIDRLPYLPIAARADLAPQELVDEWRETYAKVRCRSFEFLGTSWPQDPGADIWHRDPISGNLWPCDTYCFSVPYRGNADFGDVKFVWELNRLQFLPPLAALSALTDDPEPARLCLSLLDEWIEANPPFQGVNWASGIELALRVISILTVLGLIDRSLITPPQQRRLSACLEAHGFWLMRYPSRFSSANNHLIAEAAALFALGTCWVELPQAKSYADYGRQILTEEVMRQVHPDGVGAEQSPSYTSFTLEWCLLALWIGESTGAPFPASVIDRLKSAGVHLRWMLDAGDHAPRIGDDDEGRVFFSGPSTGENYVSSVFASLGASLNEPDLAPAMFQPHLRDLFFGRANANSEFPEGAQTFESGGYTIFRRIVGGKKILLVLDHGPLGYLSIAAHGHADALAIWLHVDDKPVLVDAGTYLYHSGHGWRDYFRGTQAHNTLTIDDTDSSEITGPFNWGARANCRIIEPLTKAEDTWSIRVGHDGYLGRYGVEHQRQIKFHDDGTIEIYDRLIGASSDLPPAHVGFLLHPDLRVEDGEGAIVVESKGGETLRVLAPDRRADLQVETGTPNTAPQYSETFASRRPTQRLKLDVGQNPESDGEWCAHVILRV